MSALGWAAVVSAALIAAAIVGFVTFTALYAKRHRGVEVYGERGDLTIVTPLGKAHARIVVHEDRGRVYMIEYRFRREHGVLYSPPTEVMARNAVGRLVLMRMNSNSDHGSLR